MIRNILVVCTGNICRSPMAEGLLRETYPTSQGFSIGSAGIAALVGEPPAPEAVAAMRSRGIDITTCRGRLCDDKLLMPADLVLVMEEIHRKWIFSNHPQTRGKVFLLGHWRQSEPVPDPYRQTAEKFDQVLRQMQLHLQDWLKVVR